MESNGTTQPTANGQTVVAVPAMAGEQVGGIVWWRLSGTVNAERLQQTWEAAGLPADMLPGTPSPETALHRAVKEQAEKRRLIRPLEDEQGWAVVDERAVGDALDWQVALRVKLDAVGRPDFAADDIAALASPMVAEIRAAYDSALSALSTGDVGGWLVRLSSTVKAVALRDTGGVYFVPRDAMAAWRKMAGAVRAASANVVFEVPALRSDEAVEAILDAVTREAEGEAAEMEKEMAADDLGSRALQTRTRRCEAQRAKLAGYEGLLGRSLDALHQRLESLQAGLAAAALSKMEA